MKTNTLTRLGVIGVFCITIFTLLAVSTVYASTPPATPTGLRIETVAGSVTGDTTAELKGSVKLRWDNPNDSTITGYDYYIQNKTGKPKLANWYPIPNSTHTTTEYIIPNLFIGTGDTYSFRLKARKGGERSEESNAVRLNGCPFTRIAIHKYTDPTIKVVIRRGLKPAIDFSVGERNAFFGLFMQMCKRVGERCEPLGKPIKAKGTNAGNIKFGERAFTIDKSQWGKPVSAGQASFTSSCPTAYWSHSKEEANQNGVITFADEWRSEAEVAKRIAGTGGIFNGITYTPPNTAPTFTEGATATRSIPEGAAPDTAIGNPITATDTTGDTITYSIAEHATFKIDSATGQLKTKINLGCTMAGAYEVVVTATDSGSLTDTITVTIRVTEACDRTTPPANTGTTRTGGNTGTGNTGTGGTRGGTGNGGTGGNTGGNTGTGGTRGGTRGTNAENSRTLQGWGGAYLSSDSATNRVCSGLTARRWYQCLIQQALARISAEQVKLQQYHTAYKAAETPAEKVQYRKLFYQSAFRILADIVEIRKNLLLLQALQ